MCWLLACMEGPRTKQVPCASGASLQTGTREGAIPAGHMQQMAASHGEAG